jgi:hypothetical protein
MAVFLVLFGVFVAVRHDSRSALRVSAGRSSDGPTSGTEAPTTTSPEGPLVTATTAPPPIEPSTTTTEAVAPASTTTTGPLPGTRTPVMAAADGTWTLARVDSGSHRCLELEAGTSVTGSLLCDAAPPATLWGDYATVATPIGTVLVAMVDPKVTGLSSIFGGGITAQTGPDPKDATLHYAVGVAGNLGGADTSQGWDLFLMGGENTLGRAVVSLETGPHAPPTIVTTKPYGVWPGYHKAGYTGLFYGGNEDVGFYDNPSGDGSRCVLWRRFGGAREGMILDVCPPVNDSIYPFAEVRDEGPIPGNVRVAVVVATPNVTRWTCAWDTGAECLVSGSGAQVIHDSTGSLSFLAYFPGAFPRHGDHLTVTAYNGDSTLGSISLDVLPPA